LHRSLITLFNKNVLISFQQQGNRSTHACLILAPISLANASLACVQMLGFDVSDDVVTGAGTVHLPWGLVFSHL
jgi:hypothetical protein